MNRNPTQLLALAGIACAAVVMIAVSSAATTNLRPRPRVSDTATAADVAAEPAADASEDTTAGEPARDRPDDAEPDAPSFVPPDLGPVPEIVDISGWLNTDGTSFDEVRDTVTIVQFWTFGCHNCRATLPHLQELYAARHDDGLEIIGIHAHEFDRERDPANVAEAVDRSGRHLARCARHEQDELRGMAGIAPLLATDLRDRCRRSGSLRSHRRRCLRRARRHRRRAARRARRRRCRTAMIGVFGEGVEAIAQPCSLPILLSAAIFGLAGGRNLGLAIVAHTAGLAFMAWARFARVITVDLADGPALVAGSMVVLAAACRWR